MGKRDAEEMGGEERFIWHARGKETGGSEDGGPEGITDNLYLQMP